MAEQRPVQEWEPNDWREEAANIIGERDLNSDIVICGAMLLASMQTGPWLGPLARAVGCCTNQIRPFFNNFKASRVFHNGKVCVGDWLDEDLGSIAFCCDASVGLGLLKRAESE